MVFSIPALAASASAGSKPASSERIIRVLTGDGCTELTRTPCLAASSAATLVMPTSACLKVTYGSTPAEPSRPATDEVLTPLPAPALYICGRTCFMPRSAQRPLIAFPLNSAERRLGTEGERPCRDQG